MHASLLAVLLAIATTLLAAPGHAAVLVETGVNGGFDDDNVISAGCVGGADGPATTITGCLNSSHTTLVDFTSDEDIVFAAGGQAKIVADDDDGFSELGIALQGGLGFETLIIDIDVVEDGSVTFDFGGAGPDQTFAVSGNGNNFFSISGEVFQSITFTTTAAMDEVRQIRLGIADGPEPPAEVPWPASALLLGIGLVWAARRSRPAHAAA